MIYKVLTLKLTKFRVLEWLHFVININFMRKFRVYIPITPYSNYPALPYWLPPEYFCNWQIFPIYKIGETYSVHRISDFYPGRVEYIN